MHNSVIFYLRMVSFILAGEKLAGFYYDRLIELRKVIDPFK